MLIRQSFDLIDSCRRFEMKFDGGQTIVIVNFHRELDKVIRPNKDRLVGTIQFELGWLIWLDDESAERIVVSQPGRIFGAEDEWA